MRSVHYTAAALAAATFVFGGTAWAGVDEVKVPFPFVVHGTTLPSGTYRIQNEGGALAIQGEGANRASIFAAAIPSSGHDPARQEPALTFTHHDNQYWLTDVWDSAHHGLTLPLAAAPAATQTPVAKPTHAAKSDHATSGTVKSITDSSLVLAKPGPWHREMTFQLDPAVHKEGSVAVGSRVSIRYRDDGARHVATAITARKAA